MATRKNWRKHLPARARCPYCDGTYERQDLEPDHDIPLAAGGADEASNIVPACFGCNRRKSDTIVISDADRADVAEGGRAINQRRIFAQARNYEARVEDERRQRLTDDFMEGVESDWLTESVGLLRPQSN